MNPGKVIDPYPIASNLREGPDFHPLEVKGVFDYPADGHSFTQATKRCVGVGSCRRNTSDEGVMCPSYMATLEEKHSTRGRARLLFEMVDGETIQDGFASRAVEEALDLCLGCKGCKSDCPMHVDMARYKAEFRSRHYARRLRPRAAYAMGQIHRWAALGQRAPALANALCRTPGFAAMAKAVAGVAAERTIPPLAAQSFQDWFARRRARGGSRGRVLVWPDTFNNHFRPAAAVAAVEVLETLGFSVEVPQGAFCCGRALYDWGWLEPAKRLWRRTLDRLQPQIAAGLPVIGLEPACVSAFRDELPGLFPDDPLARRLAEQTRLFTEFLAQSEVSLPPRSGAALLQIHCHHHAVLDPASELKVLHASGLDAHAIPSGCCGMAGSFGFEAAKYEISRRAAERVLAPAIRAAPADTLIVASGFSCREQIEQLTGRPTLHAAEALARGLAADISARP
jgi:Fe-S oxidoreductase